MNRFEGKIVVITGASRGIGLATAQRIVQEKGTVIISSSNQENINKALETLPKEQSHGIVCDISNKENRQALVDEVEKMYGRIDVLILNQGYIGHIGKQMEISEEEFDKTININLKGNFFMIQQCLPLLKKGTDANILMTSSMSSIDPFEMLGVYGISKAGINNMCISLAKEFMEFNIRINAVAPGFVDTEMAAPFLKDMDKNKKGIAKPEEIANFIAMICSKEGSFMNGETYFMHAGKPQL